MSLVKMSAIIRSTLTIAIAALALGGSALAQHPGGHPGGSPAAQAETPASQAAEVYLNAPDAATAQRLMVEFLASEDCNGRRTGTAGADLAADYLAAVLSGLGCEPAPGARGMKQGFSVTRGIHVTGEPRIALNSSALGADGYTIAGFSGSGNLEKAPAFFAGYGIVAPELNWNDYAGYDVTGHVVVVVRGEPQLNDPDSPFAGDKPSTYSDMRRKASTARDLGAAAVIFIGNPFLENGVEELPELRPTFGAANIDLPVLHLRRESLVNALIGSTGYSWHEIIEVMDLENTSLSTPLEGLSVDIELSVEKEMATGFNVVAVIPGSNPQLAGEYVAVGAHYDHLGHGGPEMLDPERWGEVHPGADDNASGVAAVVGIAQWAADHPAQFGRSLLVTLFSGEEMGLLGSAALVRNAPVPLEDIHSMVNLDMVGHLRDDTVIIGGIDTAPELGGLLEAPAAAAGLRLNPDKSGLGGSDHMSFIREGIPSLFLCTGAFHGYHTPDDAVAGVDFSGISRVTALAAGVSSALATWPDRLAFNPDSSAVPAQGKNRGKLKVSMGTVPHYGGEQPVPGMGVGDVVPGGPADNAGIEGGDVIIKIMDRRIADIYDFMYAMQDCEAGQVVPVVVYRDGEELTFDVTLAARNVTQ